MKTVLVTAIGSFAAEPTILNLKKDGYRVVGCDIYPAEWVVNSKEVDRFYQAPYAAEPAKYLTFLKEICDKEQIDGLLPLTDLEIDVLTGSSFREEGMPKLLISGREAIGLCRDKRILEQYLSPLDLCPTIPGQKLNEAAAENLEYPVVVKPYNGRSSQGLQIVQNEADLRRLQEICRTGAENYLVQRKIEGSIITVDVVRNPESGQVVCVPRRELLRTLNGCGTTVYLFSDERLENQCRKIAEALDIRGCVNFEFIEESQEKRYFLECNPRFSGGVAFSCTAGYDMVKNHMRCFTGGRLDEKPEIPAQYLARRYAEYQMKIGE